MAEGGETRSPTMHRTPSQIKRHVKGYQATPKEKAKRAARGRARYKLEKEGKVSKGDGKDVDHKKLLSKGGTNARSNLRVSSRSKNRGHGTSPGGRPPARKKKKT
jgi:hypothetical protein